MQLVPYCHCAFFDPSATLSENGTAATKMRHVHHENSFKRKVILRAKESGNKSAACHCGMPGAGDWQKLKKLTFECKSSSKGHHSLQAGRFPDLEDELADCTKQPRVKHLPATTEVLRVKALEPAIHNRDLSRSQFESSQNWITRFMKCKGFSSHRHSSMCQKLPMAFEERPVSFQQYVLPL